MNNVVLHKEIDISVLKDGMTIPRITTDVFGFSCGKYLQPGDSKNITIIFNDKPFQVQVRNNALNQHSRSVHPNDIIQIRYSPQSAFAQELRLTFQSSWNYLKAEHEIRRKEGSRKRVQIPANMKEYLVLYDSAKEDVFTAEAILNSEMQTLKDIFRPYQEQQIESFLDMDLPMDFDIKDPTAGYKEYLVLDKVRKLDRNISLQLKHLYNYKCQICGELVGPQIDVHPCESHHIDYFSKSCNNDMSNQIIVCPNHHRIIHAANPTFNRSKLQFQFSNGFTEKLTLNRHLVASK